MQVKNFGVILIRWWKRLPADYQHLRALHAVISRPKAKEVWFAFLSTSPLHIYARGLWHVFLNGHVRRTRLIIEPEPLPASHV